jgi:hypothetical protein
MQKTRRTNKEREHKRYGINIECEAITPFAEQVKARIMKGCRNFHPAWKKEFYSNMQDPEHIRNITPRLGSQQQN